MIRSLVARTARARPVTVRWFVAATGLLLVSGVVFLMPGPFRSWALALNSDVALLIGLLAGAGLGFWRVRGLGADAGRVPGDQLTGLLTQDQADAIAGRLIERDAREGTSRLALVLVELDGWAEIRRRYGKAAVGALLRMVGKTLASECRAADLPFRCTGGTLAVYLHCADIEQAQAFARRIRMLLASQQLDWEGDVLKPVVRTGIAMHRTGQGLAKLRDTSLEELAQTHAMP